MQLVFSVPTWRVLSIESIMDQQTYCCSKHIRLHDSTSLNKKHMSTALLNGSIKPNILNSNCSMKIPLIQRRSTRRSSLCPDDLDHCVVKTNDYSDGSSSSKHRWSQRIRSQIKNLFVALEEETSDATYQARHARLEVEEIKHERLARRRIVELELRQRLEERDQASWVNRGFLHFFLELI